MSSNKNARAWTSPKRPHMWKLVSLGVLIVIVAGVLKLTIFSVPKKVADVTIKSANQETKGEPTTNSKSSGAQNTSSQLSNGSQPGDQKSNDTTSITLLAPSGDFVSNHRPGQNGSPLTETSVCNTTPGATCQITFTKGDVTKSLPIQTTDRGGSTYWNNWRLTDYGLTTGSWQIKAITSMNGQTKDTNDAIALVVP